MDARQEKEIRIRIANIHKEYHEYVMSISGVPSYLHNSFRILFDPHYFFEAIKRDGADCLCTRREFFHNATMAHGKFSSLLYFVSDIEAYIKHQAVLQE